MVDWKQVESLAPEARSMEKSIRGYSYEYKELALVTDDKVCHLFVNGISDVKNSIFQIIDLLYELEKKEPISKELQRLKDELDIFSDEVKARHCDWKDLNEKWTVKLVEHDHSLLSGLDKLNNDMQKLFKRVVTDRSLLSPDDKSQAMLWSEIKKQIPSLEKQVDELVRLFKEREGICNLRPLSLQKTYEKVKQRIDRQI
jgi:hypothetical protein